MRLDVERSAVTQKEKIVVRRVCRRKKKGEPGGTEKQQSLQKHRGNAENLARKAMRKVWGLVKSRAQTQCSSGLARRPPESKKITDKGARRENATV